MSATEHTPSAAPLPPELTALDFEPCENGVEQAEHEAGERIIALACREVSLRGELAHATRLAAEAENEFVAADTEIERRTWRRRALIAEYAVAQATYELDRVLRDRAIAIKTFATSR